ncbi:hypothetical protein J5N97_022557 [Dioscorea zingiberensis]|uniref:Uncharacterized protein n=1 Tax=Dioscorea zingiberensis TaxID=325984 RepID=A0A9D5CBG2_9LILI|nr:hypothetical protein J5N97_022557 [Dioscorea zingiberensis]
MASASKGATMMIGQESGFHEAAAANSRHEIQRSSISPFFSGNMAARRCRNYLAARLQISSTMVMIFGLLTGNGISSAMGLILGFLTRDGLILDAPSATSRGSAAEGASDPGQQGAGGSNQVGGGG